MRNILVLCLLILSSFIYAQRYETVTYGFWSNPSVWKDGLKPNCAFSDTVTIKHPIVFDSSLHILPNAYFKIDSTGAICGHKKIIAQAIVHVYGYFQTDSLRVDNGGYFQIFGPGNSVATYQTNVKNGGAFSVTGGSLTVGSWFECRNSDFFYINDIDENINPTFSVFPNPSSNYLFLKGNIDQVELKITDLTGKLILFEHSASKIDISELESGIYLLYFLKDGIVVNNQKIVKN